ncbi:MAG: MATE family efflux transporter [Eubacteriales bacterium]|nr:MATE family efflux transporter [Eubacteriales bacterium]
MDSSQLFGSERIGRVLLKMAPPVMLAQLIQALYNIVDSLFVGRYAETGLTALSIIYPLQLLMIALSVGAGVGINTVMAARLGTGQAPRPLFTTSSSMAGSCACSASVCSSKAYGRRCCKPAAT